MKVKEDRSTPFQTYSVLDTQSSAEEDQRWRLGVLNSHSYPVG